MPQDEVRWLLFLWDAPIGPLILTFTSRGLFRLDFGNPETFRIQSRPALNLGFPPLEVISLMKKARRWLGKFFTDKFGPDLAQLPLDLRGTPFQLEVWRELLTIPRGETLSYQEVARRLGKPKAARAVGGAVGSNPIAVIIPCHRVIAADGSLGGYGGGLPRKRWLLKLEGWLTE